jgi:ribosomal protein S27E
MATKPEVPLSQVFRTTPGDLFQQSRATSEQKMSTGEIAVPQHKPVHTGVACPDCNEETPVFAIMGRGLTCRNGHKFIDTDELLARKPKRIEIPTSVTRQEGYQEVRLSIPADAVQQLQQRFGDKLAQTLSGVLFSLARPHTIIVSGEDVDRLVKVLGEDIKDGQKLFGLVYAMNEQKKEFQKKAETAETLNQKDDGVRVTDGETVAITFSIPGLLEKAMDRARFRGQTLAKFIEDTISSGIDAGWA